MRLNQTMRRRFVAAVMADVPHVDYFQKATDAMQAKAKWMLPKELQRAGVERHLTKTCICAGNFTSWVHGGFNVEAEAIAEAAAAYLAQAEAHRALSAQLESVAAGCSTVKELEDALPDLKKYMPAPNKAVRDRTVPVVITSVMESLKAAGFPKGVQDEILKGKT